LTPGTSRKATCTSSGDIGYRASASAYSREVLAATFNVHIDDLPEFPFTKVDPLIVTRNNPVDEHAMGE
jgi:oxalate decarboxylase